MKKLKIGISILAVLIVTGAIGLTGCSNEKYTKDYVPIEVNSAVSVQFPDFKFDNNEGQYYMSDNSAAAENGYYFITKNVSKSGQNNFIYYFDMTSESSVPLCSNIQCKHNDSSCDAYITNEECLGQMIWYYSGRLYMIERTAENDILVSYDTEGRNKNTVCILSEGNSFVGYKIAAGGSACISGGYLYYTLYDTKSVIDNIKVHRIELKNNAKAEEVGAFSMDAGAQAGYQNCFRFYPLNDKVYIYVREIMSSDKSTNRVFSYDITEKSFNTEIEIKDSDEAKICRGDIYSWVSNGASAIDSEENIYYISFVKGDAVPKDIGLNVYSGICILNKYNISTKVNKELYVLESSNTELACDNTMKIGGYDGQYIYLYESLVPSTKKSQPLEDSNNLNIMNADGSIVDKIHFSVNSASSGDFRLTINVFGGDQRYLMISTTLQDIIGMEYSDEMIAAIKVWVEQKTQANLASEVVAVLDKNQIGSGKLSLTKVKVQ